MYDLIACEYGWSIDRFMNTPIQVLQNLVAAILARRHNEGQDGLYLANVAKRGLRDSWRPSFKQYKRPLTKEEKEIPKEEIDKLERAKKAFEEYDLKKYGKAKYG